MPSNKSAILERRDGLIVQKLGDEAIVYDRVSHRAHSLNRTAALVFDKLDGKTDLAGIGRQVGKALGPVPKDEIVAAAVNELASADLLRPGSSLPRRTVLRGLAAGLLPVVATIAVPSAAAAGSCLTYGDPCIPFYANLCCAGLACFHGSGPGVYICDSFSVQ